VGLRDDARPTRLVGVANGVELAFSGRVIPIAVDDSAGGEVGTRDDVHQLVDGDLFATSPATRHVSHGVAHLSQIVRRDIRGHADSDAHGAIHQQVGQRGGQYGRLLEASVEVIQEVDGVLVDVMQHERGDLGETCFGIAHGCGAIAIDAAEVALSIHQALPHRKDLSHANHRHVD